VTRTKEGKITAYEDTCKKIIEKVVEEKAKSRQPGYVPIKNATKKWCKRNQQKSTSENKGKL